MFLPRAKDVVGFSPEDAPRLVVFVDAEEEFRWHTYSPAAVSVRNIARQFLAQDILSEFGMRPTYLVDYPVATQAEGSHPLRTLFDAGRCTIGAQLHPWVNPPIEEEITPHNTYAGNLPAILERAKIERLTAAITQAFGTRPEVFKAGRYGAGPNTAAALLANGYRVDASVMPLTDFSADGGPDYSEAPSAPYWLDRGRLLEIPTTVGLTGLLSGAARKRSQGLFSPVSAALRIPGALARFGLLERIRLSPEGFSLEEAKRLTLTQFRNGQRLFVMSYHSSSLLPGGAPYVANQSDLSRFLGWLDGYLQFFFGPLSGQATTAAEIFETARAASGAAETVHSVPFAAVA